MIKPATTFEEQVNKLCSRGCLIDNKEEAVELLKQINYYKFTGYLLPFRSEEGSYKKTTLNQVYQLYEFDRHLRMLLFSIIEEIEVFLRTQFSYYHAHKYGPLGYEKSKNFKSICQHEKFMSIKRHCVKRSTDKLFVRHHNRKYKGRFPLWVVVELLSIENVCYFYINMKIADQKRIAAQVWNTNDQNIRSWLLCLIDIRNACAHYSRLYDVKMKRSPRMPLRFEFELTSKTFDYILVLKFLYCRKDKWESEFVQPLKQLLNQYSEIVDLECLGFPIKWEEMLLRDIEL